MRSLEQAVNLRNIANTHTEIHTYISMHTKCASNVCWILVPRLRYLYMRGLLWGSCLRRQSANVRTKRGIRERIRFDFGSLATNFLAPPELCFASTRACECLCAYEVVWSEIENCFLCVRGRAELVHIESILAGLEKVFRTVFTPESLLASPHQMRACQNGAASHSAQH